MRELYPAINVQVVSYGTGAGVFRDHDVPVHDLGVDARGPLWPILVEAGRLLRRWCPSIVVSHEEYSLMPLCQALDVPALLLTHWFTSEQDPLMQACAYADLVLFLEQPGLFVEPLPLANRVKYVGPISRKFSYLPGDRARARRELGIRDGESLIAVLPGSWTEALVSSADLLKAALQESDSKNHRLIWVAGKDAEALKIAFADYPGVQVLGYEPELVRLLVASDLAITKGSYATGLELQALGVPALVLGHGNNPIDDVYSHAARNVEFQWLSELDGATLALLIREILGRARPPAREELLASSAGAPVVAREIAEFLHARTGLRSNH